MERAMRNRAEEVRRRAVGYAPEHSGVYKQSFRIESTRRGGVRGDRAEARVINSAPHAAAVEWGNARTPRYRPLGRAAGAGEES